jgi:hypothetical protein
LNGLPQLFQLCFHIVQGHIPHRIAHVFRATYLLTMTKPSHGVCPIIMGEVLYRLTDYTLCLYFCNAFTTCFSLHQFKVANKGRCETIIYFEVLRSIASFFFSYLFPSITDNIHIITPSPPSIISSTYEHF